MSGNSNDGTKMTIAKLEEEISKIMGLLSVTTDDFYMTWKPKNLSDMPVDVVGLIIERSDYKEQLILRKTSKFLRELVDKQQPSCTRLKVSCKSDWIICYYNDHCVAYVSPTGNHEMFFIGNGNIRLDTITTKANYEEVAFGDLASTLKNPKLLLETFSFDSDKFLFDIGYGYIDFGNDYYDKFENMESVLKSINHQLSVKACKVDVSCALSMLQYLKPGVLEKITIVAKNHRGGWEYHKTRQVLLLDQWKQAKELVLENGFHDDFLMEHATHFKRFQFREFLLTPRALYSMRYYMLEHENVEFCSISPFDLFYDTLGTRVSPNTYHYTIPNSQYYLELMIRGEGNLLTIEKKKKKSF